MLALSEGAALVAPGATWGLVDGVAFADDALLLDDGVDACFGGSFVPEGWPEPANHTTLPITMTATSTAAP